MAYSKKVSRRYRRTGYRRRYTRKRRYRRKYPRRSGKRFPKGVEVKSMSKSFTKSFDVVAVAETSLVTFWPGFCSIIGDSSANNPYSICIPQGTGMSQRIGAKIEPIKLRISGCISIKSKAQNQVQLAPNFWQVRCVVYQVKGGNASNAINDANYHPLAMATVDGTLGGSDVTKLLMTYHHQSNSLQFSQDDWTKNNYLCKIPMRRGIGGSCRVLYKKCFWINTQKNPVKPFRFVTKTPKRLIYPETAVQGDANTIHQVPTNAIYIVWLFQPGSFNPDEVPTMVCDYNVDLFYTDK